jgi:hypothetical protein
MAETKRTHHHLLRLVDEATPTLIWWNFVHLFLVSFVPFSTAWAADSRFLPAPVCAYAVVFLLVDIAYCAFLHETLAGSPAVWSCPPRTRKALKGGRADPASRSWPAARDVGANPSTA